MKKDQLKEINFVKLFAQFCEKKSHFNSIHIETNSRSKHMDCELEYKEKYIRLEAKVFNDSRNKSQTALKIFGGIMKGRSLETAIDSKFPTSYGILIRKSEESEALKRFKAITTEDWNQFGKCFDAKYIFVFDEKKKILRISKWQNYTA